MSVIIFLYALRPRPLLYLSLLLSALAFSAFGFVFLYSPFAIAYKNYRMFCFVLIGSGILIAIAVGWNILFFLFINIYGLNGNIFRNAFFNSHAPIYCIRQLPKSPLALIPLLLSLLFFIKIRGNAFLRCTDHEFRLKLFLFTLLMITISTMKNGYDGIFSIVSHYATFADDLKKFNGISEILRHYTTLMKSLSIHNSHYPPGNLILFEFAKKVGFIGGVKIFMVALSAMTIFPMEQLGRELGIKICGIRYAMALFSITPGIIIFPAISMAPLFMFLTILSLQIFVSGATKEGYLKPIVFGIVFALLALFSFMFFIVGLLIGIFSVFGIWYKCLNFARVIKTLGFAMLTFIIFYVILFKLWEFNIIECFHNAVQNNIALMDSKSNINVICYLLRSTGNIIAYFFTLPDLLYLFWQHFSGGLHFRS